MCVCTSQPSVVFKNIISTHNKYVHARRADSAAHSTVSAGEKATIAPPPPTPCRDGDEQEEKEATAAEAASARVRRVGGAVLLVVVAWWWCWATCGQSTPLCVCLCGWEGNDGFGGSLESPVVYLNRGTYAPEKQHVAS